MLCCVQCGKENPLARIVLEAIGEIDPVVPPYEKTQGYRIVRVRNEMGLTQKQFAKVLRVGAMTVSTAERCHVVDYGEANRTSRGALKRVDEAIEKWRARMEEEKA